MSFFLPPYSQKHIIAFGGTLLALLIGVLLLSGQLTANRNPGTVTQVIPSSPAELKQQYAEPLKRLAEGQSSTVWAKEGFLILDVRPLADYDRQHIAGSLSAPLNQLQYTELEPNTELVVFSTASADLDKAVEIFRNKKMEQVRTLQSSLDELQSQGFKLATTPAS
jgi:rhodanese-related sulfurtransferase